MSQEPFASSLSAYASHVNGPYVAFLERLGLAAEFPAAGGALLQDAQGKRYIDCVAGYGNLNLGHNHPAVTRAIVEELTSRRPYNLPFISRVQARLAERLARLVPGDLECSLFVNSGSEAVDSALKLARLATGRPQVIAAQGAWHGFTFGAMSVSEPGMCRGFGPLVGEVSHVPYGSADAVRQALSDRTAAVIVEPIQAESGAVVPPDGYLGELAEACGRNGTLLVFDEVKTGTGKTGRFFACGHEGVAPDVILAGKSLGGGVVPIGTVTARRGLWGKVGLSFPMSSSSGGGNAPACAAALAVLDVVEQEDLCGQAERKGRRLFAALARLAEACPSVVTGYSGRGLLAALHTPNIRIANELVRRCLQRGVLVMPAFCNRSRILIEPPLGIEDELLETVIAQFGAVAAELAEG